jgi:hypothetical protein
LGSALTTVILASGAWAQGVPPTVPPWTEGFEAYALGSDPTQPSMGGWENWDLAPATGALVDNSFVLSGSKAFKNGGDSDAVQKFTATAGSKWRNIANIYIPSTGTHQMSVATFYICLNTFNHGAAAPKLWSLQLQFNPAAGTLTFFGSSANAAAVLAYVPDQWMSIITDLDFTAGAPIQNAQVSIDLDGPGPNPAAPFGGPFDWKNDVSANGVNEFQAIDLWSNVQSAGTNPTGGAYYDDMSLKLQGTTTTSFCTAKTNLCGTPTMSASGVSSATSGSGFNVNASPARSNRSGILMYNTSSGAGLPFEGGTLCVSPMGLRRAGSTNSGGTCAPVDCTGVLTIDMNAFAVGAWVVPLPCGGSPIPPNNPAPFLTTPGTTVFAQFWARFSPGVSLVSDGLSWIIGA